MRPPVSVWDRKSWRGALAQEPGAPGPVFVGIIEHQVGGDRDQMPSGQGIAKKLHLHARAIRLPRSNRETIEVIAPLPAHMLATWRLFGFDERAEADPFGAE